jgi:hypothetical protein
MDKFLIESRMFLHDIATPLTVLRGSLRRVQTELAKEGTESFDKAVCIDRLTKAFNAIDQLEGFHAKHKEHLSRLLSK